MTVTMVASASGTPTLVRYRGIEFGQVSAATFVRPSASPKPIQHEPAADEREKEDHENANASTVIRDRFGCELRFVEEVPRSNPRDAAISAISRDGWSGIALDPESSSRRREIR
jgi:hypothetical protein